MLLQHDDSTINIVLVLLYYYYRKPNSSTDSADYMSKLTKCFQHYDQVACIDWDNLSVTGDKVQEEFLNYCVSGGFIQLVESPTRNKRILDLILTNEPPLCVCNVSVKEPFVNCDHNQVVFSLFTHSDGPSDDHRTPSVTYDWERADFTKFGECLENVDWLSVVHNNLTPDDLWSAFCEVLRSIADVCVPVKQAIPSKKNTSIKHYPYSIQRATARKRLLWPQSQLQVKFIFSIAE